MREKKEITEGEACLLLSWEGESVFYNPMAEFTRSLGVLTVAAEAHITGRNLTIADVMCASGVRGIRYSLESGAVETVDFNDITRTAVKICRENVSRNGLEDSARITQHRANRFLGEAYTDDGRYDMVDIDPYGTFAPFIDNAVAAVRSGGILAVTATDLAPLCKRARKPAFRKYGSYSLDVSFCHELAARILVKSVVEAGGRKNLVATPLLTVYSDQYVRSYTRIRRGRRDFPDENIHLLVMCPRCRNVGTHRLDSHVERPDHCECDVTPLVAGPMWAGPLHSSEFVEEMRTNTGRVETSDLRRIERYLSLFLSEDHLPPYHYDTHTAADLADARTPGLDRVMDRLRSAGYEVSRTHFAPTALKTDAPYQEFLEALT